MVHQLKVHSATGVEKIIDLCDDEEQMSTITVEQLTEKIAETVLLLLLLLLFHVLQYIFLNILTMV